MVTPEKTTETPEIAGVSDRTIKVTNEGQRMLLSVRGTVRELADRLGVSAASITRWRRGDRRPDGEQRRTVEEELGIPRRAWGMPPGAASSPTPASRPSAPSPVADVGARRRQTLVEIDAEIDALAEDAADCDLPERRAAIRGKRIDALARREELLVKMASVEREAVRRSRWLRDVVEALVGCVAGCDACSARVEAEMTRLDLARPVQGALDEME